MLSGFIHLHCNLDKDVTLDPSCPQQPQHGAILLKEQLERPFSWEAQGCFPCAVSAPAGISGSRWQEPGMSSGDRRLQNPSSDSLLSCEYGCFVRALRTADLAAGGRGAATQVNVPSMTAVLTSDPSTLRWAEGACPSLRP